MRAALSEAKSGRAEANEASTDHQAEHGQERAEGVCLQHTPTVVLTPDYLGWHLPTKDPCSRFLGHPRATDNSRFWLLLRSNTEPAAWRRASQCDLHTAALASQWWAGPSLFPPSTACGWFRPYSQRLEASAERQRTGGWRTTGGGGGGGGGGHVLYSAQVHLRMLRRVKFIVALAPSHLRRLKTKWPRSQ